MFWKRIERLVARSYTKTDLLTRGTMTLGDVAEGVRFASLEQLRSEAAELPQ